MNIVDSSGWLEYFSNSASAKYFSKIIEDTENLIVPTIILYEVLKKLLQQKGKDEVLRYVAHMRLAIVVDLDLEIALWAAKISIEEKLPMADSIILATGKKYNATIWTLDTDFRNIEGVRYFAKRR